MFGDICSCTIYTPTICDEKEPVIKLTLTLSASFLVNMIILHMEKETCKPIKKVTEVKY